MAERVRIVLVCDECAARNYQKTKKKQQTGERFTIKKFCPTCGRHTLHRESK